MKVVGELTPRQAEAVNWARASFTPYKLKEKLENRPEQLPKGYRHFWRYPFGISEWNEHIRLLRRLYWQGKILIGKKS